MFIIFLIIDIWTLFAIPRSFIMFSIVSDDASYMPRALIERFMKVIIIVLLKSRNMWALFHHSDVTNTISNMAFNSIKLIYKYIQTWWDVANT